MSADLQSREQDAEAFLQALTPQLMNSEFNSAILGQSNGVSGQKKVSAENNQKTWKSLEANLKVLQQNAPTRSVSYKAKANSSGVASSAFQIEKAQSFKAKTVNTTSTLGEKYKKVDITTVGDNTKEKAVTGIEGVLGRHTDGHFKQTVEDEKMLIKKGPAVNGGASTLRANERKHEGNKSSTIPSKPGPPPMASVALKEEKTITSGQKPSIPNGKISETVKPINSTTPAVQIPSKPPAPPGNQVPSKPPAPPGVQVPSKPPAPPGNQVSSKPPTPPGGQIPSKPPAPPGNQVPSKPPTPPGGQIPSKPPAPPGNQVSSKPPTPPGGQIPSKPPAPPGNQVPSKPPTPPGGQVPSKPTPHVTKTVAHAPSKPSPPAEVKSSHVKNTSSGVNTSNVVTLKQSSSNDKTTTTQPPKAAPSSNDKTATVQIPKPVSPVLTPKTQPAKPNDSKVVASSVAVKSQPATNQADKVELPPPVSSPPKQTETVKPQLVVTKPAQPVAQAAPTKPKNESPTVTSQTAVKTEVKDVTSGNNVTSKVSSFNNHEVTSNCEPTVKTEVVPPAANFSQSKASIEKQFNKDQEPTTSKANEPIKIESAANFSQHKALLEKQLKTSDNSEKIAVAQKTTPQVKPAANFSQNRSLLEKQLNANSSGKKTPPNEAADDVCDDSPHVNGDNGPTDSQVPPPPPPPPVGGGASDGPPAPPPAPGGPPPPPPPPPPIGFTVKKSCISDSPSQSSSSGAKKPVVPQDDASAAFLAELKKRVKVTENTTS